MIFPALTIIGERINSSRSSIARAIENRDEAFIQQEARLQHEAGADYIDVNAGTFLNDEPECLSWLVRTVQAAVDAPLSLDSPDPLALKAALREHRGTAIINSITFERERMEAMVPLILEYSCGVIGLAIDSIQIPVEAEKKCDIASRLVEALTAAGVKPESIYIDPVVQPVSVVGNEGVETLKAVSMIRAHLPDVHVVCGIRNVSFQLPDRSLIDAIFLPMAMAAGIDTAFANPCDSATIRALTAAEALLGTDDFCIRYIRAYREGNLKI